RLRDLDEFEDAMLIKQKVSACFSAFIHDIETPADLDNNSKSGGFDLEKLEPGIVEHLPPGKDIKFASPPLPQAESYRFYTSSILHSIAAGTNVTYEGLTGDLSEVNFSSARMGWLEFNRNVECWRSNMIIPAFCAKTFDWFREALVIAGEDVRNTSAEWTAPRREMIDPSKEVPAQIDAVRSGLETLSDTIRQRGKDPAAHFEEIAEDNKVVDKLGLVLDSDTRKVNSAGTSQPDTAAENPDNEPEENENSDRVMSAVN
ncbi:MAG: phage portal protein, partial [candidate division Zixibacteria bacterium]